MLACPNNIYPIRVQTPTPCWIAVHDQQPSLIAQYQNYIGSGLSQFRDVFYTATNIIQTLSIKICGGLQSLSKLSRKYFFGHTSELRVRNQHVQ